MGLLSFLQKREDFFSAEEKQQVTAAIAAAEKRTSGEIRVYVESRCKYVEPLDRAAEVFHILKMHETAQRNAVLVYIAYKDHQLAVFGDKGIHEKIGQESLNQSAAFVSQGVREGRPCEALCEAIRKMGEVLSRHFPVTPGDTNELPDSVTTDETSL